MDEKLTNRTYTNLHLHTEKLNITLSLMPNSVRSNLQICIYVTFKLIILIDVDRF